MSWYQSAVVDAGRAPTLWLVVGFVVTFAATRFVTRRIRAREDRPDGRERTGLLSNIHIGGVHVHHQVWGILLVLLSGVLVFRYSPESPWLEVLAGLFGAGAALALDEFALWLHLEDVYWSAEGRKSIDAILIAGVLAVALLLQVSPIGLSPDEYGNTAVYVTAVALHFAMVIIAFLKGKRVLGLIGVVVPVVATVCAVRLAKPTSFWGRRFYSGARLARAHRRFSEDYQRRWDRLRDAIGGDHGVRLPAAVDRLVHSEIEHATHDDAPIHHGPFDADRTHDGGGSR